MSLVTPGQAAPPFALSGLDGKTYKYDSHGARLTLAVFFKTDCPTCQLTWPYLEKIHRAWGAAGLDVWGLSQDARDLSATFASNYKSTFPVLLDIGWKVARLYDPAVLLGKEGQVLEVVVAFDKAKLNHLAETIAARLGVTPVIVAPANDGAPVFKPG